MKWVAQADKQYRINPDCLLLIIAVVWLVNSLNSRHEDNSAGRDLMNAILPCIDRVDADARTLAYNTRLNVRDDDDARSTVPYNPFGMVFFRRIVLPTDRSNNPVYAPRFRSGREVRENTFQHFFGKPVENIRELILPVGIFGREAIPKTRVVTNKAKITPDISLDNNPLPVLFNLARKGHTLPHANARDGSDMESSDGDDDNDNGNIDEWMTKIWRQFLLDIIMKSPNRKGQLNPSYCRLTRAQKLLVTEDTFCNSNLAVVWDACQVKVGDTADWDRVFDHLWPDAGHQCVNTQGYAQSRYYVKWKETIAGIRNRQTIAAMRKAFRRRLRKFSWIPHAQADKLWVSNAKSSGFSRYPEGSEGPAPRILTWHTPVWIEPAAEERRGEEEEADEEGE